jgi:hypothetical protein
MVFAVVVSKDGSGEVLADLVAGQRDHVVFDAQTVLWGLWS